MNPEEALAFVVAVNDAIRTLRGFANELEAMLHGTGSTDRVDAVMTSMTASLRRMAAFHDEVV